ncbi:hypothetical protein GQX73_g10521 [Xylaria multiplex]|uniref:Uncharacterized protein n=1 Tax=Xylaria multiplex TaxID=323545 RepID=A0A7C8IGG0_9PEZI|nr:hypothetical protein GQX73_g10521 [Xylaria multiplex]
MYWTGILVAIVAAFPSWVNGQQSGWIANQVNATMCIWKGLRAAQVRDTAYMDGGFLFWVPGLADNSYGVPEQDGNPLGIIYTLNFSVPWDSRTNVSRIFNEVSKAPNGGAANNLAPNYYDGAMLANDSQFFLYGGLVRNTRAYSPPDGDEVLSYQAYDSGIVKPGFRPGFLNDKLPNDVTRYVTYGGAASAPSENKAWYFGGSRSQSGGPIYQPSFDNSVNPLNHSKRLITLDIGSGQSPEWTNTSLPDSIPSRANPSVVWVPVGEQGILVVLGGVTYPQYATVNQTSSNEAQSDLDGPGYMSNIDIYDIANGTWYQQPTIPGPPMLALGCAVVATAQDASSYNIYYYGGFDGIHANSDFNDDVWVLSLPSFIWTRVSQGDGSHGRAGHQCLTPYPDQMITIGGYTSLKGAGITCLDGGILQIFNLTEGTWLDSYDPNSWNVYGVPEKIHAKIGGGYSGGATMTAPSPTGWAAPALASVFATKYPASKLTTYYPYSSQGPGNTTRGDWENPSKGGGGTPSWVAPVLGVVLGLVFLTAIAVGIMLYRKRAFLSKRSNGSDNVPYDRHHRIRKWLNSTGDKEQTLTTEEVSRGDMESRNEGPLRYIGYPSPSPPIPETTQHEMPGNPHLFELMDTSATAELGGAERRGSAAPHEAPFTPVSAFGLAALTNPANVLFHGVRVAGATKQPELVGRRYAATLSSGNTRERAAGLAIARNHQSDAKDAAAEPRRRRQRPEPYKRAPHVAPAQPERRDRELDVGSEHTADAAGDPDRLQQRAGQPAPAEPPERARPRRRGGLRERAPGPQRVRGPQPGSGDEQFVAKEQLPREHGRSRRLANASDT